MEKKTASEIKNPPIVENFLNEQQDLTAVEQFAEAHSRGFKSDQKKYYQSLIPTDAPEPGQQYAFEVDLDRCSGCKACITGCHNRNGLLEGETWRAVGLIHTGTSPKESAQPMTMSELSALSKATKHLASLSNCPSADPVEENDLADDSKSKIYFQNITTACHHCADPACLTGCPVKAYEKNPATGIVKHLDDQCIGCKYCIYRCPYEVPQYVEQLGIVRKCDMCMDRLNEGEAPACVQSCPNQAISITLVDIKAVESNPGKDFQIPSSPDAAYTKPTTQYKTARGIPEGAVAGDQAIIHPQPAEWPLVFMLVFTQAAVGIFSIPILFPKIFSAGSNFITIMSLAFAILGFGIGTLHLGRPLYAFRSFLGLRTSWLSREILFFGLFLNLLMADLISHLPEFSGWMPSLSSPVFQDSAAIAAAVTGILGILSSSMIYKETPRRWWNSKITIVKFYLTACVLGGSFILAVRHYLNSAGSGEQKIFTWVLLGLIILKLWIEGNILSSLMINDHPWKKTAWLLMNPLKSFTIARFGFGICGMITLTVFFFPSVKNSDIVTSIAFAGFLLLLIGECLERHLFFRAVVPPRMPGQLVLN